MKNFFTILSLAIMFGLGWFGNEALQTQKIYAAAKVEYKVVNAGVTPGGETAATIEKGSEYIRTTGLETSQYGSQLVHI